MKRVALVLSLICALAMWVSPARAQAGTRLLGDGVISQDGSLVAFNAAGTPDNEFAVLEVNSGRSFRFALPASHSQVADLAWAPSTNTLMFISRSPPNPVRVRPASFIWSIDFAADGPQPAKIIAKGEGLRLPALSPDGSKLAWFQLVPLPAEEPPKQILLDHAYAVFEKNLATGAVVRVAKSQYSYVRKLFYETDDAWLFSADEPAYMHENYWWAGKGHFWSGGRPGAPPGKGTFGQLTGGIKSFRMERGETLPDYPDFKRPYPATGTAPLRSWLSGMTTDGRPILFGAPGPENTEYNHTLNTAKWYVGGPGGAPLKEGFVAVAPDGQREIYFPPALPQGYHNNPAGFGMDGKMKRFFKTAMKPYANGRDYGYDSARLFLYEGESLVLQRDLWDIIGKATTVLVTE